MAQPSIKRQKTTLDATGMSIGRLASAVARLLQGKHRATYVPHIDAGDIVEVRNAGKLNITGKKAEQKKYFHYSGYPGGMKETELKNVLLKNAGDAITRAVKNMLPKNRQQKDRMKRLTVHND